MKGHSSFFIVVITAYLILGVVLVGYVSYIKGYNKAVNEAIDNGVAHYTFDPTTGEPKLVFGAVQITIIRPDYCERPQT